LTPKVPLLQVEQLRTYFKFRPYTTKAVDDVSFSISKGEIYGLVGESGSGKSITALSILGLVPEPFGKIIGGRILFEGKNLLEASEDEMKQVRGRQISMIFQDPLTSLDPIMRVGEQIKEAILAHEKVTASEAKRRSVELLGHVGIQDASYRLDQYPFQLSGGMRQRIMIAIALASNPSLLIADEPTTNLDATIQAQILEVLARIRREFGTSILLITHNLGIVAWVCDRISVMYAGQIVETATTETMFEQPVHPYTMALLRAVPRTKTRRLLTVPGEVASMNAPPSGCRFHPRCEYAKSICAEREPQFMKIGASQSARCLMQETDLWK